MRIEDVDKVEFDGEETFYFREVERVDPSECDVHKTTRGEKLEHIAYEYYGDPQKWYIIADANKDTIGDPMEKLEGGLRLLIPPQR